jgi:hypothetical protein
MVAVPIKIKNVFDMTKSRPISEKEGSRLNSLTRTLGIISNATPSKVTIPADN